MKNGRIVSLILFLSISLVITPHTLQGQERGKPITEGFKEPLRGWKILDSEWNQDHLLDLMAIEWEYFMIHDGDSGFVGIIGYVLTNPRARLSFIPAIVPAGGNLAVGGMIHGKKAVSEYINFGAAHTKASGDNKHIYMNDPATGYWGKITPLPAGAPDGSEALRLSGSTELFSWDLMVYQSWSEMNALRRGVDGPFTVKPDWDVGYLPGEVWTLDAVWPRTAVVGTVKVRATGEVIQIDGKGYRENSWGRYLLSVDGWDFLVFSDDAREGTMIVMQTYHKSNELDFMDVMFYDKGTLKAMRLLPHLGEAGWYHGKWQWDGEARQCVPLDTLIIGEKNGYRVEANIRIPPTAQKAFLSNEALGTAVFFIQEQYPWVKGQITRIENGEIVARFEGQAGGEFALSKSAALWPTSNSECESWGRNRFFHEMPERQDGGDSKIATVESQARFE